MHVILEKPFKEISPWAILWLPATIFGNPIYNVFVYLICDGLGFSKEVSTNVTQVDVGIYVLLLMIIFSLRYVVYRILYLSKLKDKMSTFFFVEVFLERHKWQVISVITFFMWAGEVEGNIAGFLFFPVTLLCAFSISIVTMRRLYKMNKYIEVLKSKL